jgi:4-hydroxy-2-oxoheptanedioate aldolase
MTTSSAPGSAPVLSARSIGVWCMDSSPSMVHLLARSGFEWVCLDAQHGLFDRAGIAAASTGYPSSDAAGFVVRVPGIDPSWIGFALDAGAGGVLVPQVETRADAEAVVKATYYPPIGNRSWGPMAALSGQPTRNAAEANSSIRCAVMIESSLALDNVSEIASVPGVDMLFVGPYDLSLSLNTTVTSLLHDRSETSPLRAIAAAAAAAGIDLGAYAGNADFVKAFRELGYECLVAAGDTALLQAGIRSILQASSASSNQAY